MKKFLYWLFHTPGGGFTFLTLLVLIGDTTNFLRGSIWIWWVLGAIVSKLATDIVHEKALLEQHRADREYYKEKFRAKNQKRSTES